MNNADLSLKQSIKNCRNKPLEVFESDPKLVAETIAEYQIPDNSLLGALARTGGFHFSGGALKLLGSPQIDHPSILSLNAKHGQDVAKSYLIIAFDIYGNFYGINVNYDPRFRPGEIIAFFADGTDWESTADDLSDFLGYCFEGNLRATLDDFKLADPALEIAAMHEYSKVIDFFPPLYANEGDPKTSSARLVDLIEVLNLRSQLRGI